MFRDKIEKNTDFKTCEKPVSQVEQIFLEELEKLKRQEKEANDAAELLRKEATHDIQNASTSSTNLINTASTPLSTVGPLRALNDGELSYPNDPLMPHLEHIYASPSEGIFTDSSYDHEGVVTDFNNLETTLFRQGAKLTRILKLMLLKKAIGTKWVYRNKKDEMGVVVRNKARLVSQGHRQEEGIDYAEVFTLVARIEAIRIFLDFASYMGFIVYQMDVKSAFLYGTIDEEVYVSQPPGFIDPKFPNKVYKFVKLYMVYTKIPELGMLLCLLSWRKTSWFDEFEELMKIRFQMISMGELTFFLGLQFKQKEDDIFISQDKYVAKIPKKFDFLSVKTASTPTETQKPLVKDEEVADVDVYLYRSMNGSLMYLTASRPDIMFVVYACSRFQVTPKTSHLQAMKRIFRKSTTGGCQFLGRRLISWQCKKQSIVATSTTKVEYVTAVHCCGQVLWIQNKLLDNEFNFMNTKIYIDNKSTICIVKIRVFHSKTKHINIRHHFIRDAYEKKLIQVLKIYTNDNVADLLTKAFDDSRFNFLVVNIRLLNL
nr:hypothetical protein [Tanacetum cinerariifolium]